MQLLKLLIAGLLMIAGALACYSPRVGRYSITESKTHAASLFRQNCAICHGQEAEGKTLHDGRVIPNIRSGEHKYKTDAQIYDHITYGGNGMVPFRDQLTERERRMLVDLVQNDLRRK